MLVKVTNHTFVVALAGCENTVSSVTRSSKGRTSSDLLHKMRTDQVPCSRNACVARRLMYLMVYNSIK